MTRRVPKFQARQNVFSSRRHFNKLVDRLNEESPRLPSPDGVAIAPMFVIEVAIRTFLGVGILECADIGSDLDPFARKYRVLVPTTLTPLTRDGVTYVYTDTNNRVADTTETQIMTPVYLLNDHILIVTLPGSDGTWRDLNVDGRQWAAVP